MAQRRTTQQRVVHTDNEAHWAVDKRINISIIFAMGVQLLGLGYWIGGLQNDVRVVQRDVTVLTTGAIKRDTKLERLIGLERDIKHVRETVKRMEETMDRILQYEFRKASAQTNSTTGSPPRPWRRPSR